MKLSTLLGFLISGYSAAAYCGTVVQSGTDTANTLHYDRAVDYSTEHKGRGVVVLVGGAVAYERYDNGGAAAAPVHIHSSTKAFWCPAAAAMIDDGLLSSFDELAADTLTEWKSDPRRSRITVRHLLSLTSGLAGNVRELQGVNAPGEDRYALAIDLESVREPGDTFNYGPSQFYVFGVIMSRKLAKTGESPVDYLRRRILDPIGVDVPRWQKDRAGNPNMPNGAYITAMDWATYGQFVLQEGEWHGRQIVPRELIRECFEPTPVNPGHGLAFWLNRPHGVAAGGGQTLRGTETSGFVYSAGLTDIIAALGAGKNRMYIVPSLDMVIARQAEGEQVRGYSDDEFLSLLFTGQGSPAVAASATTPTSSGTSGRSRVSGMIDRFDRDGDGGLSPDELPGRNSRLQQSFSGLDRNGDGVLSEDELERVANRAQRSDRAGQRNGQSGRTQRRSPSSRSAQRSSGNVTPKFVETERVARLTPAGVSYIDPEFLAGEALVTFQHRDEVWVGELDPVTGLFVSNEGRNHFIDSGAARLGATYNGPEFGLDANGWAVYYAKEDGGEIQIWQAYLRDGVADSRPLTSGARHQTQILSKNASSDTTRLLVIRGSWQDGVAVWFDADDPSREHEFDIVEPGSISVRWIDGTSLLTWSQRTGSERGQLAIYDTDKDEVVAITRDAGHKTDPYGWIAPEFGDELLVLAIVDDREIAVYRDVGDRYWERILTLGPPPASRNRVVGSAEPFVVGGKSYLSLSIKSEDARIGNFDDGEIWVFGIEEDPAERTVIRCDDGQYPAPRFDPESWVGSEAFIYYSVLNGRVFEIRRCRTGLTAD